MARDSDHLAGGFETENTGFLAEEDDFDRRSLWRLGSWGAASVGAVIVALLAGQSSTGSRREQMASADVARQSQQIQFIAKESLDETRRLASAIDTLNSDRDRLYARVTVLEQGLDTATGAIARQTSTAPSPPAPAAAPVTTEPQPATQKSAPAPPVVSPVAAAPATPAEKPTPVEAVATVREPGPATVATAAPAASNPPVATPTPLMDSKSMLAPPDAAAGKLIKSEASASAFTTSPIPEVVAPVASADEPEREPPWAAAASRLAVQRTEFGVDIGGANSVGGLRALWRGLRSNAALSTLRPIIVVKESSSGLGMQLRLVVGPLGDAAAAAKICATLTENKRACETTVFDGQRLVMKNEEPPASVKTFPRRRSSAKRAVRDEPPPPKPDITLSSFFGKRDSASK
jgi:TolA-binding protein